MWFDARSKAYQPDAYRIWVKRGPWRQSLPVPSIILIELVATFNSLYL